MEKRDGTELEIDMESISKTMDYLISFDLTHSSGSGTGISLTQLRPQGAQIISQTQSRNSNILNWFNNYTETDKKKWVVQYKSPFKVYHVDDENPPEPFSWGDDRYERRLDAEKFSLKKLIGYAETVVVNPKEVERLKAKLETIEKDHPEWLI